MRLFVATALLLLGFAAVPNAAAQDPGLELADPGLTECRTYYYDAQGDGSTEPWTTCSTPTCGCDCPYVGAGLVVEAADQQVGAAAVTSGCQTAYSTSRGEADGGAPATVWPIVGGGGLGDIEAAVDLSGLPSLP
jgi:hypothetical protein